MIDATEGETLALTYTNFPPNILILIDVLS